MIRGNARSSKTLGKGSVRGNFNRIAVSFKPHTLLRLRKDALYEKKSVAGKIRNIVEAYYKDLDKRQDPETDNWLNENKNTDEDWME